MESGKRAEKWITVFRAADELEANLVAIALRDEGVEARVEYNPLAVLSPARTWEPGVVNVQTPDGALTEAFAAIKRIQNTASYQIRARGWSIIDGGKDHDDDATGDGGQTPHRR